ncbi:RBL15, partial [Symbiodinium sp. KB8]
MANLLPGGLPAGTALFAGICAAVFGVQYAFAVDTGPLAIGAFPVVFLGEWFRLASSAFLHGGILHILMNMASLLAMGPSVESILGTAQFVTLVLAAVLLEGLIYVCVCVGCWAVTSDAAWLHMYAVGFSGVLFTLAVEEASLSPNPTRSVFGLFRVPTRLYPWVLLVLLQFAIPNISFLGHLSGLLVGVLHVGGLLAWLLPSMESSRFLETLPVARALRANGMLCPTPSSDPVAEAARRAGANGTCFGTVALAFVALWQGALPAFAHAGGVDRQKMAPPGPAQTRPHCDLHCIEARSLQCPRQMGFSVRQLLQHSPQQMQPQLTLSLACGLVVTRVSMGRAFCDPVLAQMECISGGKARLEGGSRTLVLPQHQAKFA